MNYQKRFEFISHALNGTGGFDPLDSSTTPYLIRYPRESQEKFDRRLEVAFYVNDLLPACSKFAGHLAMSPPDRQFDLQAYELMSKDVDGQGTPVDMAFFEFAKHAKAFGSMLLLVDGPREVGRNLLDQQKRRLFPRFRAITPDRVTEFELGDDGLFDLVSFTGTILYQGKMCPCIWTFTRFGWSARLNNGGGDIVSSGTFTLGECPVIAFTEFGQFPCFGPFSQIATLSKRLYNLNSELDEILRGQTFSLLTYHVPPEFAHKFEQIAGRIAETIGTDNLLVHNGEQPGFIAPPEGPAKTYLERIDKLERKIADIAMDVDMPNGQESGITMKYRYQALNAALSEFSGRLSDFETKAWELASKWLRSSVKPEIGYKNSYMLADIVEELSILQQMQSAAMPRMTIAEQMRRIVSIQFGGLKQERLDELTQEIDEAGLEVDPDADTTEPETQNEEE